MPPCYGKLLPTQYVRKKTGASVLANMSDGGLERKIINDAIT